MLLSNVLNIKWEGVVGGILPTVGIFLEIRVLNPGFCAL